MTNINVDSSNAYFSSEDGVLFNKEKTELNVLKIVVVFSNIDVDKICKKLNSNLDDSDNITIESTKNEINIKILKDETV